MKALLVDDHGLFRHGMELLLSSRLNFDQTLHACNSDEALKQQADNPDLDLVLLDYNLGKDLGLDVLTKLKKIDPALPIAMVSGRDDPEIIFSALGSGASGFIFKHIEPDDLVKAIHHIMAGGMYVPESMVDSFSGETDITEGDIYSRQVQHIAEVAKRIVNEKNLNLRSQSEIELEMNAALNQLLEELHEERSRLTALAFHDELTGLANRRLFLERLAQSMRSARRNHSNLALVYIDLDYFKEINDSHGHQAGDAVLVETAQRLSDLVRETDTVARLGGDEFTIILTDIPRHEEMRMFIDRLHHSLRQPMDLGDGTNWQPTASIGVAVSNGQESAELLMEKADRTLYQVKNQGRDSFAFDLPAGMAH